MNPTRFGLFLSPFHPVGTDPTRLLRQDIALAEHADELGFEEFWVGEHHSGGWCTIASPELFIAAAAERTRRIHFGSGVVSVPYHHPFMVAERAVMLSHLTAGRFTLGLGAGAFATDMHMLGMAPAETRSRLAEGSEVIARLLRGERVSRSTSWFTVDDAQLQLAPFGGAIEVAVASAETPSGVILAGELGANVLSHGATPWGIVRPGRPSGIIDRLPSQWEAHVKAAAVHDRSPDRADWRINLPIHVAATRERALDDIYDGWLAMRHDFWRDTVGVPMSRAAAGDRPAFEATMREKGFIAGSPTEVAEAVAELASTVGGFGRLLLTVYDWAPRAALLESLERFATQVRPRLTGSTDRLRASQRWAGELRQRTQEGIASARDDAMRAR